MKSISDENPQLLSYVQSSIIKPWLDVAAVVESLYCKPKDQSTFHLADTLILKPEDFFLHFLRKDT